ncbi:hypothetical protein YOLOSWAG_217 [Erwinia phage vB_EamM_Yoloswag]|uniref:Uncharacterized protein n=1 Tax=Erwinia phage vB_EamM_Yoloswag TaxID=1958956 RepID=A0A1S6L3D3_9CAUD|nr:hypothetical protein HOR66_gp217 [Erwinia phage vB_EamM_Yoloswag]AQT28695.1 hypothetical protein YOLOSWAG_217 [Erwinia phage vB_EamM_Yoloswag]
MVNDARIAEFLSEYAKQTVMLQHGNMPSQPVTETEIKFVSNRTEHDFERKFLSELARQCEMRGITGKIEKIYHRPVSSVPIDDTRSLTQIMIGFSYGLA